MEDHNASDSTVEFLHGQEMAYFDAINFLTTKDKILQYEPKK